MNSLVRIALCATIAILGSTSALGQVRRTDAPSRPTVSPYLSLLQGNPGVPTYQSLVRPMINDRNALQWQGRQIYRLQNQVNGPSAAQVGGATGQAPRYFNYSHYYPGMIGR